MVKYSYVSQHPFPFVSKIAFRSGNRGNEMKNNKEVLQPQKTQHEKTEVVIKFQDQSNQESQEVLDYQGRAKGFLIYVKAWRILVITICFVIAALFAFINVKPIELAPREITPSFNGQQEVPSHIS